MNYTATGVMISKGWERCSPTIFRIIATLMTSFNLLQQNNRLRGQRSSGRFLIQHEAPPVGEIIAAPRISVIRSGPVDIFFHAFLPSTIGLSIIFVRVSDIHDAGFVTSRLTTYEEVMSQA